MYLDIEHLLHALHSYFHSLITKMKKTTKTTTKKKTKESRRVEMKTETNNLEGTTVTQLGTQHVQLTNL